MESVVSDIINIIEKGRQKAYQAINSSMVESYWLAGKRIFDAELEGENRAEYGKSILVNLSIELTNRFGKGYSTSNIYDFKKFYATYPEENIFHTLCGKLTWSHNRAIMRVLDEKARLASKYLPYLPSEEELIAEIEREKNVLREQGIIYVAAE